MFLFLIPLASGLNQISCFGKGLKKNQKDEIESKTSNKQRKDGLDVNGLDKAKRKKGI